MIGSIFYVRRKNKGCYVHAMCKIRLLWAKTGKTSAYFLHFGIKLKKFRSVFDLVTVLISKQSFFQHHVWPVYQGKSYLRGIALPHFYIVSPFFYKRSKQARVPTFVWLFRDVATTAKGPGCDEGINLRWRDFAVVPLMPTRVYTRDVFYARRKVDLMKTAKVNAYIMRIFGKIELLSIHAS